MKLRFLAGLVALVMLSAGHAEAKPAPSAAVLCKKMIADGRAGKMNQADCRCAYDLAETVLDEDLRALLFDSWYNGTNNSAALQALPRPRRVVEQLMVLKTAMETACPGFPQ